MIFPRLNRTAAERMFTMVFNVSGGTIAAGGSVALDTGTFDGVRVGKPTTATLSLFVGVCPKAIVDSAYGLTQIYGYALALVINHSTVPIVAGDILVPVDGQTYLARSAVSDGKTGFATSGVAFATAGTPAAALKGVFLRI